MLIDGVTVKGSYHDLNQDSYKLHILDKGFVAVLSDGLGSKSDSHIGSGTVCECTVEVAQGLGADLGEIEPEEFMKRVYQLWIERLDGYDVNQCMATMLVFVIYAGRAFAARLGDGFIGIWSEQELKVLFDKKTEYFANETDCLKGVLDLDKIEIYETEISELYGVVMCSDGVGIGNMSEDDLSSFTKEFVEGYCDMKTEEISQHIMSWLSDWPGVDDKTLAYYIAERD